MATDRRHEVAPQFNDAAARLFQRRAGGELRRLFETLLAEPVPETWLAILEDEGENELASKPPAGDDGAA